MNNPTQIRWLAILAFVAVAAVLFILDRTGNGQLFIDFLFDPLATTTQLLSQPAQNLAENLSGPSDLQTALAEIETLQTRVEELEKENELLRELEGEYTVLTSLFDYAVDAPQSKRVLADVIGWEVSPLFQSIIINKGTADGVRIGMPVDSPQGMVGQIFRTTETASMVLLITDSSSSIPVRLSTSRATGLLHGGGLGGDMIMDWIPLEANVEVGDVVTTSGLVGQFQENLLVSRFPKGLILGRVTAVERSEAEILQRAVIQSAVNFRSLEKVFVVTEFFQEDLTPFENPAE